MTQRPKKWPDYALSSLEETLMHLKTIERLSREVQVVAKEAGLWELVILGGDVREKAQNSVHLLVQARTGDYDNEHGSTTSSAGGSATNYTTKGA